MTENTTAQAIDDPEAKPPFSSIPGNVPIWIGIFSELTEFGIFFVIYFIARSHNPDQFLEGPTTLFTTAGTVNTLLLISSSFFVAKAIWVLRHNQPEKAVRWLWGTIVCGLLYLIIKWGEYEWNTQQGIEVNTNSFFTVYYYMTFNHMLHVGWGTGGILWALLGIKSGAFTAEKHGGLIAAACYWHMIDLAWIMIFPLLYVVR